MLHTNEQLFQHAVHTIQSETIYMDAVKQLENLAHQGHTGAAKFLEQLYRRGFRVEKDSFKAEYWHQLSKAAA